MPRLPPALVYQGLASGPGKVRTYEIQPGIPVDGSDPLLRDPKYGSPFTFRMVPPPILMDALAQTEQVEDINIIGSALKVNGEFDSFTRRIEDTRAGGFAARSPMEQTRLANLVANNGVMFDPKTGARSQANVLGIADVTQAMSVISQLNAMLATPPLTLLINPQSLAIQRQKKQQYQDRTRRGLKFKAWGEEQIRLNVSGRTGAFYAGTRPFDVESPQNFRGLGAVARGRVPETTAPSGVQYVSKRDSASFQNLQNLLIFFKNNGYIFDLVGESQAHWWIGMIAISYDQWTYAGHMENFSWGYTEQNNLGGLDFTFDYVASFVFDNAQREFQVLPIEAPTESPSDRFWSNPNSRPMTRGTLQGRLLGAPQTAPASAPNLDPHGAAILRGG